MVHTSYDSHTLPESLLKILSQNLWVYVEARTDSQWRSDDVADNEFGAKPYQGENSLVVKTHFFSSILRTTREVSVHSVIALEIRLHRSAQQEWCFSCEQIGLQK